MTTPKQLTYSKAIAMVLCDNGGYAPLSLIYENFSKYRPITSKSYKEGIRERLQRDKQFTSIGYGVYALTKCLNKISQIVTQDIKPIAQKHTDIQGMLIELGNMNGMRTYTPDKTRFFENKQLGKIATIGDLPPIVQALPKRKIQEISYIDVIWFNKEGFPKRAFEVENSTNFSNSLLRLSVLENFKTRLDLVALEKRKNKYEKEVSRDNFTNIEKLCHFVSYSVVESHYKAMLDYTKTLQMFNA